MPFTGSSKLHRGFTCQPTKQKWLTQRCLVTCENTHIRKQGYPKRDRLCLQGHRAVQWDNLQRPRFGLASPQRAALWEKQWFDLSLRSLKWSYCQIQDAHLEGECLTGKRANYKFRLLPWCFADPSTGSTGTPWKARDRGLGERGAGRGGAEWSLLGQGFPLPVL